MSLNKILQDIVDSKKSGVSSIDARIKHKYLSGWRSPQEYFSVSQLFYCPRWAFLNRAGAPSLNSADSIFKMEIGTFLHKMIQDALRDSGVGFSNAEMTLSSKKYSVLGHPDGMILDKEMLVEIKTVSSYQASSISKSGMPDYYIRQANTYAHLWNCTTNNELPHINKIWFIVLDRNTCKWVNIDPVSCDIAIQEDVMKKLTRYKKMWASGELPPTPVGNKCNSCLNKSLCLSVNNIDDIESQRPTKT
jgi:CRISPR/Cas system-associated exonuclease Cas4 (RecB family)